MVANQEIGPLSNETNISILYFASLGEYLKCENEFYPLTESTLRISDLKSKLSSRGEEWNRLQEDKNLMCAVNQTITHEDITLKAGDEVAFFPPVTGG